MCPFGYIIFQSLNVLKICPVGLKRPKQVQEFAKYKTKTIPKNPQRLLKFCQSGEISPNLVTLCLQKAIALKKFAFVGSLV